MPNLQISIIWKYILSDAMGHINDITWSVVEEAAAAPKEVTNFAPSDLSGLQTFDGYGQVGFQAGESLPPPPPPVYEEQQPPSMEFGKYALAVTLSLTLIHLWKVGAAQMIFIRRSMGCHLPVGWIWDQTRVEDGC